MAGQAYALLGSGPAGLPAAGVLSDYAAVRDVVPFELVAANASRIGPRIELTASLANGFGREPGDGRPWVPSPLARPLHAVPFDSTVKSVDYDVLGSVAIRIRRLPSMDKWQHVMGADYTAPFEPACGASPEICSSSFAKAMRSAAARANELSGADELAVVNRAVNHAIAYKSDRSVWGVGDYWANPEEIARKGAGDCEDFAIAKLWFLRSLGFSPQQLQLVILDDTRNHQYHAVLGVHLADRTYILDNLTDNVATDGAFINYMPIMSFAADTSYIHGFRTARPAYASLTPNLGTVLPGEGDQP